MERMDGTPFLIDVCLNQEVIAEAFIDQGCLCFGAIRDSLARSLRLERVKVSPRQIVYASEEAGKSGSRISEVVYADVDIDGLTRRHYYYPVPHLSYPLILGKPWMEQEEAVYYAGEKRIALGKAGFSVHEKPEPKADIQQVAVSHLRAIRRKARKETGRELEVFAISLHDINRQLEMIRTAKIMAVSLPEALRGLERAFDPDDDESLPPHRGSADHAIELEVDKDGNAPRVPWGPLYSMSRQELLALRKTLMELMSKGYVRASSSAARAPVLFVKKADGGLRFCCDYRGLNAITKKDRYPLPLIHETLRTLTGMTYFSKVDVRAAFNKLRVRAGDEWKTAFGTRFGLFEWTVLPFGLSGGPATFQRYINNTLREFLDICCTAYMDDVLIYSNGTEEDHMAKVRQVIEKLLGAGLRLDSQKSAFAMKQVRYLGFIIEAGVGVKADPEKTRAIQEWEAPKSPKGLRGFLGFTNFYREFINFYAEPERQLTPLLKKGRRWAWEDTAQAAFDKIKAAFLEPPVLAQWDPARETFIDCDSSGWASGGVLLQKDEDGALHPIAYHSQKHSPAEANYDIHDKELVAIIKCMRAWDSELRSVTDPFVIRTDHSNLSYFLAKRHLSERQVRWLEFMDRFRFKIKFRPGRFAGLPDALSRRDQDMPADDQDARVRGRHRQLLKPEWLQEGVILAPLATEKEEEKRTFEDTVLQAEWVKGMKEDEEYPLLMEAVRSGARSFPPKVKSKVAVTECDLGPDGALRYRERRWVPAYEPLQTALIQRAHDSVLAGHPGRNGTMSMMSRRYYWPGMVRMVRRFVKNCDVCGRTKVWRDKKKGLLKPLPIPERFWSELSVDFMTDLPAAKEGDPQYLMVITDRLTKAVTLEAMTTMAAEACAERFVQCFVRFHGVPRALTSDRGSNWTGGFWRRMCELLKIEQRLSTAYHPQTDGATERANQEVQAFLRAYVAAKQLDWPALLPAAQLAINNRDTSTIGLSPFFMTHGFHMDPIQEVEEFDKKKKSPSARAEEMVNRLREATEWAREAMATAQATQEDAANKVRAPSELFKVGDRVWLKMANIKTTQLSKKLGWVHAKYTVTRVVSSHAVELNVPQGIHPVFNCEDIRLCASDPLPSQVQDDTQPPPIIPDDFEEGDDPSYLVEEIVRARTTGRGRGRFRQALVKWVGYAELSWEPVEYVEETEALERYEKKYGDIATHDGPPPLKGRKGRKKTIGKA